MILKLRLAPVRSGLSCAIAAGCLFVSAQGLHAADEVLGQEELLKVRMGLGAGVVPDYPGSDDYKFLPLPNFELSYGGYAFRSSRLGVEADVVAIPGLDAGPIIRYDGGRSSSVNDSAVALLPEIDGSVELGAFVGAGLPLEILGVESQSILTARVEFLQGLDGGHEGSTVGASVGLVSPLTESLTLISAVSTTYISENYADSYFDISAAASAASGLAVYDAGSGFRDVGVSVLANYKLNESWSINGLGSYSRIIGDAASSPVVEDRGSANQFFGGLGFSYTFQ
jgi:MipA family protein